MWSWSQFLPRLPGVGAGAFGPGGRAAADSSTRLVNAPSEARGELGRRANLRGGADQARPRREHQGVAAVEHGERRERVQARVEGADGDGGTLQRAFEGAVDAVRQACQAFAGLGQGLARIVAQDGGGQLGDVALRKLAELAGERCFHAEARSSSRCPGDAAAWRRATRRG
jgi:hypothetical protein